MGSRASATAVLATLIAGLLAGPAAAGESEKADQDKTTRPAPMAILAFEERGRAVDGYGKKIADMLFAKLVANPKLHLVDRSQMEEMLEEAEMSRSGMIDAQQATQVGRLTGAKLLLTGSVFEVGDKLHVVGKLIGTETSRVMGASAEGAHKSGLGPPVEKLAKRLDEIVTDPKKRRALLPEPKTAENVVKTVREKLGDASRPVLAVRVEERHVGEQAFDPAIETELLRIARKTGFEVIAPDQSDISDAEVLIKGEGFSEFAARRGDLVSVKARVELKAVRRDTDRVIASDRQTTLHVGIAEQTAGKKALQTATQALAERVLPKLVAEDGADGGS